MSRLGNPPNSSAQGIFQARILEWFAISWKWQEMVRFPGNLPNPGIESESPLSPALKVDSSPAEPLGKMLGQRREDYFDLQL